MLQGSETAIDSKVPWLYYWCQVNEGRNGSWQVDMGNPGRNSNSVGGAAFGGMSMLSHASHRC